MKKDLSYLTNHYDAKIEKIKKINAPLNIIFYTDPHNGWTKWDIENHSDYAPTDYESAVDAIESMQYIIDRLPNLKCVVCGGDLGNEYQSDPKAAHESIKETMDALYKLTIPVHCCLGNHDDCGSIALQKHPDKLSEFLLTPKQLHEICMRNNPTDKNYYYIDFEELNYRFIFLHTSDYPFYGFTEDGSFIHPRIVSVSREQVLWFKEAVKTDKRVIVFAHSPISTNGHYPDCTKGHQDMANGDWLWHEMQQADNVLASIAGHLHFDNVVYDGKIVAIDTMAASGEKKGWDAASPKREFGTITETAFDVLSITDEVIYCTRFGAGEDRVARIIRNING